MSEQERKSASHSGQEMNFVVESKLDSWIEKIEGGEILKQDDLVYLLNIDGKEQEKLFTIARGIREENFGKKTNVRGVVEISNYCSAECQYCPMQHQSTISRYRLNEDDIFKSVFKIKEVGIKEVFLQSGEDRKMDRILFEIIPKIKKLGLKITLSLGERDSKIYQKFKEIGVDGYILKHETSSPEVFLDMRPHSTLEKRLACLKELKSLGFEIGTGTLLGLPKQNNESIVNDLLLAKELDVNMISVSPLVINRESKITDFIADKERFNRALNYIALSRILFPKAMIPTVSALETVKKEVSGKEGGQVDGFNAGANNITVNFTPPQERDKYAIYDQKRFIVTLEHVFDAVKQAGLEIDLDKVVLPAEEVKSFFEQKWDIEQSANVKIGEKEEREAFESLYNYTNPTVRELAHILVADKNMETPVKILDLGSGDGRISLFLANILKNNNIKANIEAEDFSPNAIKRQSQRAEQLGLSKIVTAKVADIEKRKYIPQQYDAITCCNTLHYWNEDKLKELLGNIQTSTKENGYNCISFECNIDMALVDSRKFIFANQPDYNKNQIEEILKEQYKDWEIIKVMESKVEMEPSLPTSTQKLLNTEEQKYKRSFILFEILAKKIHQDN